MAPVVDGDQAEFIGQGAFQLGHPGQMALHETMDQQDGQTVAITPFASPNIRAAAARHLIFLLHVVASRQSSSKISGPLLGISTPATHSDQRHVLPRCDTVVTRQGVKHSETINKARLTD